MSYLLDTRTLAEILRATPSVALVRRLSQVPSADRFMSVVTVSRLIAAARRYNQPRVMQYVIRLIAAVRVVPFDLAAAQVYGKIGTCIGDRATADEFMIAATAASRSHVLVTATPDAFAAVPDLRCEYWLG
ncbi:MAG: type II toxin-antitoxin system VapC family toxin [Myxococcales bacterium]|nr:type II toxin-antitoxin system VapC family toxin [Myxococcales bacterium]